MLVLVGVYVWVVTYVWWLLVRVVSVWSLVVLVGHVSLLWGGVLAIFGFVYYSWSLFVVVDDCVPLLMVLVRVGYGLLFLFVVGHCLSLLVVVGRSWSLLVVVRHCSSLLVMFSSCWSLLV